MIAEGTNITDEMKRNFRRVIGRKSGFALFSCFLNGKPTAAIVAMREDPDKSINIFPLFVAVTDDMKLTDHEGVEPRG